MGRFIRGNNVRAAHGPSSALFFCATVGDAGGGEAAPAVVLCEVSVEEGLFSLWTVGMTNVHGLVAPKRVLGNIGGEMHRLAADPGYIDGILRRGAERASAMAGPILHDAQTICGLLRP